MAKALPQRSVLTDGMDQPRPELEQTDFGFRWGQVEVTRVASWPRGAASKIHRALRVHTRRHHVEIYVSPSGNSVRVFRNGVELVDPATLTFETKKD